MDRHFKTLALRTGVGTQQLAVAGGIASMNVLCARHINLTIVPFYGGSARRLTPIPFRPGDIPGQEARKGYFYD